MKLNVYDRITILSILPEGVGSFSEYRAARAVRRKLAFGDAEREEIGLSTENGVSWENDKEVTVEFSPDERAVIIAAFRLLADEKRLPTTDPRFDELFDKIVGDEDLEP